QGLVAIQEPARQAPLPALAQMGRASHEQERAVPLDDRVQHDVPEPGRMPVFEGAGDHRVFLPWRSVLRQSLRDNATRTTPERRAMTQDLRSYLDLVKRKKPDDLVIVSREVNPAYEMTAVAAKLDRESRRRPILVFENVRATTFPVLTNLHASRSRLALAMG